MASIVRDNSAEHALAQARMVEAELVEENGAERFLRATARDRIHGVLKEKARQIQASTEYACLRENVIPMAVM